MSSFHLRMPGDGFGPTGHRQPGETEGRFPRQSLWRRPLRRRLAKQTGTGSGTPTSRPNSIGPITPIRTRSMPIFLRKSWLATGAWSGITKSSPMRSRLSSQSGLKLGRLTTNTASTRIARARKLSSRSFHSASSPNPVVFPPSRACPFVTPTILGESNRFRQQRMGDCRGRSLSKR